MKVMTCRQLGGACDLEFKAETFEEISTMSKNHGMEMMQKQDPAHLEAMQKMHQLCKKPEDIYQWMADRKAEFDALDHI